MSLGTFERTNNYHMLHMPKSMLKTHFRDLTFVIIKPWVYRRDTGRDVTRLKKLIPEFRYLREITSRATSDSTTSDVIPMQSLR